MHAYTAKNGTVFNYNGDMTGDVVVRGKDGSAIDVPGEDLLDFVGLIIQTRLISRIESAEPLYVIKSFLGS
jgi:hypothetical protein